MSSWQEYGTALRARPAAVHNVQVQSRARACCVCSRAQVTFPSSTVHAWREWRPAHARKRRCAARPEAAWGTPATPHKTYARPRSSASPKLVPHPVALDCASVSHLSLPHSLSSSLRARVYARVRVLVAPRGAPQAVGARRSRRRGDENDAAWRAAAANRWAAGRECVSWRC